MKNHTSRKYFTFEELTYKASACDLKRDWLFLLAKSRRCYQIISVLCPKPSRRVRRQKQAKDHTQSLAALPRRAEETSMTPITLGRNISGDEPMALIHQ